MRPGLLIALYLVGAGIERFLVELVRLIESVLAGLTAAQLWSIGLLLLGVAWLALVASRGGLAAPGGGRVATAS